MYAALSSGGSTAWWKKVKPLNKLCCVQEVQVKMEGDYVELEMDALNTHECMPSLVALVKHMQRNNIFPPPQAVS